MSGRKNTDEQVAERLAAVEAVMLAGEYNRASANGLSDRYGVTLRQIQRDAAKVRESWRENVGSTTRAEERSDWLMRVRGAQARSFRNGHSMAAARLMQLEGQALGVYEPTQVEVNHVHTEDPKALLKELREALPMINTMLGVQQPQVIEATYKELTDATQEEG
jgi:hypothetical protein